MACANYPSAPFAVSPQPKHPGEVIQSDYLDPLEIPVQEIAARLGVTRQSMSKVLHGHAAISIRLAIGLSQQFGRTAEEWLLLQTTWDLWKARQAINGRSSPSNISAKT